MLFCWYYYYLINNYNIILCLLVRQISCWLFITIRLLPYIIFCEYDQGFIFSDVIKIISVYHILIIGTMLVALVSFCIMSYLYLYSVLRVSILCIKFIK